MGIGGETLAMSLLDKLLNVDLTGIRCTYYDDHYPYFSNGYYWQG